MELKNRSVRSARKAIGQAYARLAAATYEAACSCEHKELAECDYQSNPYGSADAPNRVCLHCGLMEEGWGCGYIVLNNNRLPIQISRDQAFALRTVRIDNDDKGPILRREINLSDLLARKLGIEAMAPL